MPSTRRIDSDFGGLVKRVGEGIGFSRRFQSLDGSAARIVGPIADKDHAA